MADSVPALHPSEYLRSVDATRSSLGKAPMKLIDVVDEVRDLARTDNYAVVGGMAQILWARKSHTDDLDIVLAEKDVSACLQRAKHSAGWAVPPDAEESDDVFRVVHLMYAGSVVDLLVFACEPFNAEILRTAQVVPELGNARFIAAELLLVTHLLRPGPEAAIAAIELVIARRKRGGFDEAMARRWAGAVQREERLNRVLAQADAMDLV